MNHNNNSKNAEEKIEKEIQHVKAEIRELEHELHDLEKNEHHGGQHHHHHTHHEHKGISLKFIVNGTPVEVHAQLDWLLKKAVEEALNEAGSSGRALDEYTIKYNNRDLDLNKTIKELHLPECAEIFVSPNAGTGGSHLN